MNKARGGEHRLRRTGEAALWLIVIVVALIGALRLLADLRLVALPVLLALVLATFSCRRPAGLPGSPRGLAALAVVTLAVTALALTFAFLVPPVVSQFKELDFQVSGA